MANQKLLKRTKKHKIGVINDKLSPALSCLHHNIGVYILFEEVKLIAQASQSAICIIRESLEILTRDRKEYNDALYNIPHIWFGILRISGEFCFE